jgi:hypothetical protein
LVIKPLDPESDPYPDPDSHRPKIFAGYLSLRAVPYGKFSINSKTIDYGIQISLLFPALQNKITSHSNGKKVTGLNFALFIYDMAPWGCSLYL